MRRAAAALLLLALFGAAVSCTSAPQPTPELSPTAAAAVLDQRITLPTTMGLAFNHPKPGDRVEHQVLYTVQQSVRAQLHAEYGSGQSDPLLSAYWSGDALGAVRGRKVDVRVIAATNKDLKKMVDDGKFREDLWYRINVVRVVLPPLVDRRGDVPLLAHYFLKKYNERYHQQAKLTESGVSALQNYSWPGNVRQLQHLIERLTILAAHGRIDDRAVEEAISLAEPRDLASDTLADTESEQIRRVLAATGGNKSRAAKILGIERKTLYRKLERMTL